MPKLTAFRPGLECCVNSAGLGLRHDIRKPAGRSRYRISSGYFSSTLGAFSKVRASFLSCV